MPKMINLYKIEFRIRKVLHVQVKLVEVMDLQCLLFHNQIV